MTERRRRAQRAEGIAALVPAALAGEASGPPVVTGFPSLDSLLGGGLRRGDLVVLAGDVGAGKSALALAFALRATAAGHAAACFSAEMDTARVMERALAIEGRVRVDDLRRGGLGEEAHSAVAAAALTLKRNPPSLEPLRDAGVEGVSGFLAANVGIDLTVIDPVQALTRGTQPLEEEVADVARRLKELALRRSAAILAVTGLRESPAGRPDQRRAPARRRPRRLRIMTTRPAEEHLDVRLVVHTHWDREWYRPAAQFLPRLVSLVDEVLDGSAGSHFLLDGQAVVLEDYLAFRPERAADLSHALRSGRLEAGPWYVLADELIPSGEGLVRNLLAGRRVLAALRASPPPVLYCPDSFGHPAALPAIAAGFGLPVAILWRGFGGRSHTGLDCATWRGPSGRAASPRTPRGGAARAGRHGRCRITTPLRWK